MKPKSLACLAFCSLSFPVMGGDWGKAPVDKVPIEECVDLGGTIGVGYHSEYLFRGYKFGDDAITIDASYTFEVLLPITIGFEYVNVTASPALSQIVIDDLALYIEAELPTVAGIESRLSFTQREYSEDLGAVLWPSGHGEFGLHLTRDLGFATANFDLLYNLRIPNSWNGTIPAPLNEDNGAWYWDFGLERRFDLLGHGLVLSGGVAYADNYWGDAPTFQTGGEASGWNHYYLEAALPIDLNCRTRLTPYIGFVGAPEGWLMDGAPNWWTLSGQSDVLHGGFNLSVSF